jgi:hypothetical protein
LKIKRMSPFLKAIVTDARLEAEAAESQLHEIVECLRQGNHLGALGEFPGLEDRIQYVRVVLMRAARLSTMKPSERKR